MDRRRLSISVMGLHLTLSESMVRRLLRLGFLSGTELVRPEEAGASWQPLHATRLFVEGVAHVGDPAQAAHRRRLWWWWPVALPLMGWMGWIGFITATLAIEPPPFNVFIGIVFALIGMPSLALALWTRRFRDSIREVRATTTARPVVEAEAVPREAEEDRERLRAELEVIQRLRDAASDSDRRRALEREEQALIQRMVRIRTS